MSLHMESKTLHRALTLLHTIQVSKHQGLTISEMAKHTQIPRSSLYRYLPVLMHYGLIHKDNFKKKFYANNLNTLSKSNDNLVYAPLLTALKNICIATGDSSFLIKRDKTDSFCIKRETGTNLIQVQTIQTHHKQPLGVGSAGLALLSVLDSNTRDQILRENEKRLIQYGQLTLNKLRLLIKTSQDRGWAVISNTAVPEIIGVGIAIKDQTNQAVYGLSVSSIENRYTNKKQKEVAQLMIEEVNRTKDFRFFYTN